MWDLIVSVSDHCLSFYFTSLKGLFIVDFNPYKIIADNSVKIEMQRLREH